MKPIIVTKDVKGHGHDFENTATFHTRFKFTPHSRLFDRNKHNDADVFGIQAIPGVTETACYDHQGLYDITVKKATAFNWEEIEPKIIGILLARHERLSGPSVVDALQNIDEADA